MSGRDRRIRLQIAWRSLRWRLGASLIMLTVATVGIAAAQSTAELEQQLQELKQQYAESTRAMEQRIASLEKQIEAANPATPKQGTVALAELAAQSGPRMLVAGE